MNNLILVLLIISFASIYNLNVKENHPTCKNNICEFYIKFKNLVSIDNGSITFSHANEKSFRVEIKYDLGSWVGISYGIGMKDKDMNIIELSQSDVKLTDSFCPYRPVDDKSLGGTEDLKLISFKIEGNQGIVVYERLYDTGDKYDQIISPETELDFSFAWGKGKLGYHGKNKKVVKFSITKNSSEKILNKNENARIKQVTLV